MGGARNVKYDSSIWNPTNVKVIETGQENQKFDIQARDEEVCIVWTDDSKHTHASSGGMTPLVYCFNEREQTWKELGSTSRIGLDSSIGDVELVLPNTCTCPELSDYYFVIVGRPAPDYNGGQSGAVVWFYNHQQPELGWLLLGGESSSSSIIEGTSRDAHLAIPGDGKFKCIPHAVVSDEDNLDGGVYDDDARHLVFARFEPGTSTTSDRAGFMTGSWLALDQLNHAGLGFAQHVKHGVNDFVFTSTGIPAVAWADHANQNHVYLSVWSGYATARSYDLNGFLVAGHNTINKGAICPSGGISCVKPSYENPTGLSIDSYGDVVYVAITSGRKEKIYVEYIDVSQNNLLKAPWQHYENHDENLLPSQQTDCEFNDVTIHNDYRNHVVPTSQNQIKLNCQGEVYIAHIMQTSNVTSTAAIAKNGIPVQIDYNSMQSVMDENDDVLVLVDDKKKKDESVVVKPINKTAADDDRSSSQHNSTDADEDYDDYEEEEDDDEESYYCRAKEFPCDEDDVDYDEDDEDDDIGAMVYVCHYSARVGHQTFCIPEADSEVLRFYSKDYCGPCVGGFGGVNKGGFM